MREIIGFICGFGMGFAVAYGFFKSKQKKEEKTIKEPPEITPFESSGRMVEILKKFNEMKQKI